MLNSTFVINTAGKFASSTAAINPDDRIKTMWKSALGREISESEAIAARAFLSQLEDQGSAINGVRSELEAQLTSLQEEQRSILAPARKALENAAAGKKNKKESEEQPFNPIGFWDFSKGIKDLAGERDLELVGSARLADGSLVLDGKGFAKSPPLTQSLTAKTLHVRLTLSNLAQKGGGAMTIQDLQGGNFDSVVFAEKKNKHWLSGSNNHKRTQSFNGTEEYEATQSPVSITITYGADEIIRGYRNGASYGKAYKAGSTQSFEKGHSQVLFGLRHGTGAGGNRMLEGRIFDARLFDRALSEEEVKAMAEGITNFISPSRVLESLTAEQKARVDELNVEITNVQRELDEAGLPITENDRWQNFAHSIFNLKEFIYVY